MTNRKLQRRILNNLKILIKAKLLNTNDSWFTWRKMVTSIIIAGGTKHIVKSYSTLSPKHNEIDFNTLYNEIEEHKYQKHHYALVSCLKNHLHKIMYLYSADEQRNDEVVRSFYDDMVQHKHIAVRATYGCGKTHYGIRPVLQKFIDSKKSVIIVTEKRSLSGHFHRSFAHMGFKVYNDIKKEAINVDKYPLIIVQLDSVSRVESNYDVLILDECCSLNTAFSNPTMNRRGNVIARFVALLKHAEMVALCDADLNDEVIHEYEEVSGNSFFCIDYTYRKLADRTFKFGTCESLQYNAMRTDMLNGHAISYTSQSVKYCKKAFEYAKTVIPNKKLVLITGSYCELIGYDAVYPANNSERKDYVLKHLNEFEDCDFLATTPTITSGISFNKKNHFYRVYGYVTSDSNSYRSYVQQINRIRYITTNEYYVFIQPRVLSMNSCVPFTLSECLSLVEYNRLVSFGKLKKSDIDKLENVIDTSITLINENKYEYAPIAKWLSAITLRETLDTRYRYFNALKTVLEFHGITCIVDTSKDDSITKGIIHNLNNTIDFNESKNMQLVID